MAAGSQDSELKPMLKIRSFPLNGLFVLALFYTAYLARTVLLPITLALFFTLLLRPVVRLMKKIRIPEIAGAALVLVFFLVIAGCAISTLSDPALNWINKAPDTMRKMGQKLEEYISPIKKATRTAEELKKITGAADKRNQVNVRSGPGLTETIISGMHELLTQGTVMLILLFFTLASGDLFIVKLMKLYPTVQKKRQVAEIVKEVEHSISRYLLTVTIINMGEGFFVGLGMYFIGMPDPVLWGVMAALLVFIPYLGPFVGILIVTIVALFTFDQAKMVLLAPLIYFIVTSLQGQFLTPMILGVRFQMNPVVIFTWLLLWGSMWGVVGAIIAVPLLTIFKILSERIEPLKPVSEFLGN